MNELQAFLCNEKYRKEEKWEPWMILKKESFYCMYASMISTE